MPKIRWAPVVAFSGLLLASGLRPMLPDAASQARAAFRPLVFAGGQGIRLETETTDDLLNPITIKDTSGSYEFGAAVSFFPAAHVDARWRIPVWEVRMRYARTGGDLPGNTYQVTHEGPRDPYDYTVTETYEQRAWTMAAAIVVHPVPQAGFYIEPGLESATLTGTLATSGTLPDPTVLPVPTSGEDKKSVRYGVLQLGAGWTAAPRWPALEGFWTPVRVQLSTTRRASESGWEGTFPDLKGSVGARVVYRF